MGYLTVTQINTAIIRIAADYPDVCELLTLPHVTHEGRSTFALRIGKRSARRPMWLDPMSSFTRPVGVLFIHGVHARERGGPEIAIAFAADLLYAYDRGQGLRYGGKDFPASQIRSIVEQLNVFVVPLVNPDGLHHITQNPGAFMWRKNRNPASSGGAANCIGVDINRNYPFLWNFPKHFAPAAEPASTNPCIETYIGTAPASEPETRNVRWLFDRYGIISRFMDVHSWRQVVLHSWGNDENQSSDPSMNFLNPLHDGRRGVRDTAYREYISPEDSFAVTSLARRVRDAINTVRTGGYQAIQSIYLDVGGKEWFPTSGASDDYAFSRHVAEPGGAKVLAFTLEFGKEFHPPWGEMEQIILDVNAGMLEFCLAAIPVHSPFPEYAEYRRLWRWQTLVPVAGVLALVSGLRLLGRRLR
jgi:murein tripeptide amidase MpaA